MKQYIDIAKNVLENGQDRKDRTGTGTRSIFSAYAEYNMADGFPLVTTKDMTKNFWLFAGEMLWVIKGGTNAIDLKENYGFGIWRKWQKDESGDLGRVYGAQWRQFRSYEVLENGNVVPIRVDQLHDVLKEMRNNPYSRRLLVSAWNPAENPNLALPPCHWAFELYVDGSDMNRLNLKLHQRSCDVFLGVPFNIGEYALLLHMIAHTEGMRAGILAHDMTNVHIYHDHIEQMKIQVEREPKELPTLWLNPQVKNIEDFTLNDMGFMYYDHHGQLKGDVSI